MASGDSGKSSFGELAQFLDVDIKPQSLDEQFEALFQPSALREVFEERFARSPSKGLDRLNGFQFAAQADFAIAAAARKCLDGTYRFTPYLENLKSKGRKKHPRLISIPTVRDRLVLHQLNKILANAFPDCVPRNVANGYVRAIAADMEAATPDQMYVCGCDIRAFYDCIPRERLFKILEKQVDSSRLLNLLKRAVLTPTVPKNTKRNGYSAYKDPRGIPQGLAISNLLAAIYLQEVDGAMKKLDVKYFRYVDDVLIYGHEAPVRAAHKSLRARLRRRGLGIHPLGSGKSHLDALTTPFGYLGYYFDWPLVTVREASVEKLLQSIASKFSDYIHNKTRRLERYRYLDEARLAEIFLLELNERIGGAISEKKRYGWIAYYSQINDLSLLHKLDSAVAGLFRRLPDFNRSAPHALKKFSRAYFEMRYDPFGGYVRNYDAIASRGEKLEFLRERGRIGPDEALTDDQINARFDSYRKYVLSQMQTDQEVVY